MNESNRMKIFWCDTANSQPFWRDTANSQPAPKNEMRVYVWYYSYYYGSGKKRSNPGETEKCPGKKKIEIKNTTFSFPFDCIPFRNFSNPNENQVCLVPPDNGNGLLTGCFFISTRAF
jgi:hypothetical protein